MACKTISFCQVTDRSFSSVGPKSTSTDAGSCLVPLQRWPAKRFRFVKLKIERQDTTAIDASYYKHVAKGRSMFTSYQMLMNDPSHPPALTSSGRPPWPTSVPTCLSSLHRLCGVHGEDGRRAGAHRCAGKLGGTACFVNWKMRVLPL